MSAPLPPIYRDCRRLLVHTEEAARRFARYHKFIIGPDLRRQVMAVMRGARVHCAVLDKEWQAAQLLHAQHAWRLPNQHPRKEIAVKTRLFFLAALLLAQPPAQAAPFSISDDGQEVTDQAGGLIWRRCAEGSSWNGATCTGLVLFFTHEAALIRARSEAAASGKAWRLPNVKELSRLVDRGRINPSIDIAAFPATPSSVFWSSSPYAGNSNDAWFVDFSVGDVGSVNRYGYPGAAHLVRANQ